MPTDRTGSQQEARKKEDPPILEINNLSVTLGGSRILEDINLSVGAGNIHALIGPNGAGKTTLIRSILGSMPHKGTIRFLFRDGGRIGYVPQLLEFDHAVPITVADIFTIMLQDAPVFFSGTKKMQPQIKQILAATESDHLMDRMVGGLSGGEFRRVLLAQALIPLPDLLLLDEPASNVDEYGAKLFEQILIRLKKEQGLTILMVGHDMGMILRVSDHVTCINRQVTFDGSPDRLRDTDRVLGLLAADSSDAKV
jgi:zinc transport system ATP-binding protein